MGFMKFMKKGSSELDNGLDIPPPPPLEGADSPNLGSPKDDFPPLPEPPLGKKTSQKDMPFPMPEPPKQPVFPSLQKDQQSPHILPPEQPTKHSFDIPPLNQPEDDFFPMPQQDTSFFSETRQEKAPGMKSFDEFLNPRQGAKKVQQPKQMFHREPIPQLQSGKPFFIEVSKYRQILRDLNNIKRSLKQSDDEVSALTGNIAEEEKTFSSLHSSLAAVEDKLVQLEHSLFSQ